MPSRSFLVFGADTEPHPVLNLRAGPLTMVFEPDTLFLRRICLGEAELIRAVYAAVRDRNWGTVPAKVREFETSANADSFRVAFTVDCRQGEIDFGWHGEIVGDAQGRVRFSFDGEARSSFLRNRIGFCVLHPLAGCVGQPCAVEHHDSSIERGRFPDRVAPDQPFKQVRAISHETGPDLRVEVRFEGDDFEMEDQRNWTDASFKTYCTPLELPFPAPIEKGTRIRQRVTLRLLGPMPKRTQPQPLFSVDVRIPNVPTQRRPPIGLGFDGGQSPLNATASRRLRALNLSHLRVDLHLSRPGWQKELQAVRTAVAELPGCQLHVAVFVSDHAEAELKALGQELQLPTPIGLWLVFHETGAATGERGVKLAAARLENFAKSVPVAAGTNANFAELNRRRPAPGTAALPCFSLNPQVHAFDSRSLVENLEAQAEAVRTAWSFTERDVVVSPITLRPRFNAVATGAETESDPDELPPSVDPRQMTLFGAAWTLGSLAALSAANPVHSLTYFEAIGWRGILDGGRGSPLPAKFPSQPDTVFPVYHVFADLAGYELAAVTSVSAPAKLAALTLFDGRGVRRVLLANLTPDDQHVRAFTSAGAGQLRLLHAANVEEAMTDPEAFRAAPGERLVLSGGAAVLNLPRYACACLDVVDGRQRSFSIADVG